MRNWAFVEMRNGIAIRLNLSLQQSENSKILWDFKIQADLQIEDKITRKCFIIDVACPFDTRVSAKEKEKTDKYQDLKREIMRIWKCAEVVVIS